MADYKRASNLQRAGRPTSSKTCKGLWRPAKGRHHQQPKRLGRRIRGKGRPAAEGLHGLQGQALCRDLSPTLLRLPGATLPRLAAKSFAAAPLPSTLQPAKAWRSRHRRHCCPSRQPAPCRADSAASRPWWTLPAQQSTTPCQGCCQEALPLPSAWLCNLLAKKGRDLQKKKGLATETDRHLFNNLLAACPTFKELLTFHGGPRGLFCWGFSLRLPWALRLPRALRVP